MSAGVEKISHLSNRTKQWSKTSLFAYLCSRSPIGVTMTRNNDPYEIWTTGNKEYNDKYMCCFFTIWNLKIALKYKYGRVVLFRTSVYFVISKLILLFSYFFHAPSIIFANVYFYIVRSMFPFLCNWPQSKASVVKGTLMQIWKSFISKY